MKRIKLGTLWQPTLTAMQETNKSKLGLVVEGGGVRAIYAAGVLDVLHDLHLPFSGVIGVSAVPSTAFRLCPVKKVAVTASTRVFVRIRASSASER